MIKKYICKKIDVVTIYCKVQMGASKAQEMTHSLLQKHEFYTINIMSKMTI
jgi:hypothetical protein